MNIHERLNLTRPLVAFDVEATGPSVEVDRVTQIGAIKILPDGKEREYSTLINPGVEAPPPREGEEEWVTIWRRAKAEAPSFESLAPQLHAAFMGCDLIGYNLKRFDMRILDAEFKRCGLESPFRDARVLCSFMVWTRLEPRQLEHAAERFGAKQDGPLHDALADARLTLNTFKGQLAESGVPENVDEIHDWLWPVPDDFIDERGKLRRRGDEIIITFGKHAGRTLREIPAPYLKWMLNGDFESAIKEEVERALAR